MRPPAAGVQVPDLPLALSRGRQGVLEVGESPVDGPGPVGSLELEFLACSGGQVRCGDRGKLAQVCGHLTRMVHGLSKIQTQELRAPRLNVAWLASIILRKAVLNGDLGSPRIA